MLLGEIASLSRLSIRFSIVRNSSLKKGVGRRTNPYRAGEIIA